MIPPLLTIVIINGKMILDNYKIIGLDERELYNEAQNLWNKLKRKKLLNVKQSLNKNTFKMIRE